MNTTKIISACAVLVALASCSSDHELSQQSAEDAAIRIQANVGGSTTRAADNIQGAQFDNGEHVCVYIYEHTDGQATYNYGDNGLLPCTADNNGHLSFSQPQYFPANGNGIDVYGVYPNSVMPGAAAFSVLTYQSDAANYRASDLMYASCVTNHKKGTPVSLSFQHKLSKVTVELVAGKGFEGAEADLNDAEVKITNTSTKCTFDAINKNGIGTISASTSSSDIQDITIGTWNSESKNKMSAIVIPQTVSAGKELFEVTLNGINKPYKYKIPAGSGVTFSEGKVYNYKLTVNKAGIVVNSTITNWDDDSSSLPSGGNVDATLDD